MDSGLLIPIEDETANRIAQAILSIQDVEEYTDNGRKRTRNITEEEIKNAKIKVYYYEREKESSDDSTYIILPYEIAKDIYRTYTKILQVIIKDNGRDLRFDSICAAQSYEVILHLEARKSSINEFTNTSDDVVEKAIQIFFNYKLNLIVFESKYSKARIGQTGTRAFPFYLYTKLYAPEINAKAEEILEQILAYMLIR
ncbi:MAG: hypothetical protein QW052_07240 [Candidatus Nitrosocaldaceae archaeon]